MENNLKPLLEEAKRYPLMFKALKDFELELRERLEEIESTDDFNYRLAYITLREVLGECVWGLRKRGEFEKRMDELAFEVNPTHHNRMVLPYGNFSSLIKQVKNEFIHPIDTNDDWMHIMIARLRWFKKWFGD